MTLGFLFVPLLSPEKSLGGFTELHKAAYLGDDKLVSTLLGPRCGSTQALSARTRDIMAATPLDIAAMRGHLVVALEMVSHAAKSQALFSPSVSGSYASPAWNGQCEKRTSLHHAVLGGNSTVVECLADYFGGSSPPTMKRDDTSEPVPLIDVADDEGWTPLMMACERSDMKDAITRLVEAGANLELVNKQGDTALIIACKAGNIKGAMALLAAAKATQVSSSPLLPMPPDSRANPARPNKANYAGDRALDRACASCVCPLVIRALLEACAVPALQRSDGSTALHCAAQFGHRENCEELIHWLERERNRMATSTGSLSEFVGTAIAQSIHLLLVRDVKGRFASDVAFHNGHSDLGEWLRQIEARDAALFVTSSSPALEEYDMNEAQREEGGEEEKS